MTQQKQNKNRKIKIKTPKHLKKTFLNFACVQSLIYNNMSDELDELLGLLEEEELENNEEKGNVVYYICNRILFFFFVTR